MTMLNTSPRPVTVALVVRRTVGIPLARLGRLINRCIAALIARYERQAELSALDQLSDRELQDIGLYRSEIGEGLAEAAKFRDRMQ
jgi:uncharacterized protein YjiS (DUF1127 family)